MMEMASGSSPAAHVASVAGTCCHLDVVAGDPCLVGVGVKTFAGFAGVWRPHTRPSRPHIIGVRDGCDPVERQQASASASSLEWLLTSRPWCGGSAIKRGLFFRPIGRKLSMLMARQLLHGQLCLVIGRLLLIAVSNRRPIRHFRSRRWSDHLGTYVGPRKALHRSIGCRRPCPYPAHRPIWLQLFLYWRLLELLLLLLQPIWF
uniref:Uncharacterized protein n=1 Tax=Drosophila pseudoobscura pseudoobscura TaxID=46245 RepID=A0A0R3P2B4_DROPS